MIRERIEERHGGYPRRCLLLSPDSAPARHLLLVLHGCGGTASWMAVETSMEAHAQAAGVVLAFPEATRADMSSPAHFLNNPPCWDDGALRPRPKPAPDSDDASWLCGLTDRLRNRFGIERMPMLAGFSNGAGMIAAAIVHGGERFGGAAFVCGYPRRPPPAPLAPVRSLFLLGAMDPLVPWEGGRTVLPWHPDAIEVPPMEERIAQWAAAVGAGEARTSGCDHYAWREWIHAGPRGEPTVTVRRIAGLGHHWPGGRGQWTDSAGGSRRDDIDAAAVIFEHFGIQ